jgi:hypothetical protein
MTTVIVLWHVDDRGDVDDEKLIGVYASEPDADDAIGRLRDKPGFVDVPSGFQKSKYELNKDHWTEGFVITDD